MFVDKFVGSTSLEAIVLLSHGALILSHLHNDISYIDVQKLLHGCLNIYICVNICNMLIRSKLEETFEPFND